MEKDIIIYDKTIEDVNNDKILNNKKNNYFVTIFNFLSIMFKSFFITFGFLSIINFYNCKKNILPNYFFGYTNMNIVSDSMEPNLNIGDYVIIEKIDSNSELKYNDIYIYKSNDKIIIHRYKGSDLNGLLYFKGDNNSHFDQPVLRSQVIGHYVKKTNFKRDIGGSVGVVSLVVGLTLPVCRQKTSKKEKKS